MAKTNCLVISVIVVVVLLAAAIGGYFLFTYIKHAFSGDEPKYGNHCDPGNTLSCSSANLTCSNSSTCVCAPNYVLDNSNPSNVFCVKIPGEIRNLKATQNDHNALVLTFLCPDPNDIPGNVQGYTIQKILLNSAGQPETKTVYTFPASQVLCTNSLTEGALGIVLVERNYNFSVRAWNDYLVGDYSQEITFYVAPRVPKLSLTYGDLKLLKKLDNSELKHTEFEVRVCSSCLLDAARGSVLGAGLVVCVQGNGNSCTVSGITQVNNLSSWDVAWRTNFDVLYLTTPTDWLISLKAPPLELNYIIGHDTSCTSQHNTTYCNGPLPANKQITVIVVKCNIAGCGQLRYDDIFCTKGPGVVRYLRATQDDDNALVLTFMCPDPMDAPENLQGYMIQKILLTSAGLPETKTIYTFPASQVLCTNSFNDGALGGVLVERNYNFSVKAFNDRFVGDYSQGITFYVAPRVPKLSLTYSGLKLLQKLDNSELKHTEFEVRVCSSCLLDASRGSVLGTGLVVCVQGNGNNCTVSGITQVSDLSSWDDARRTNFDVMYLTTPTDWLISIKAPPLELNYIIGHDSLCTSQHSTTYCNGPLPTNKQITLIMIQCNIAGCQQLQYNDIFSTKDLDSRSARNTLGLGIGMTWLVFLIVVVLVVCLTRKDMLSKWKEFFQPRDYDCD